jgi:hypothetical protein
MSALNNSALIGASGSTGYQISRSVRLRSSASAYFSRTPASTTNRRTWTASKWFKRGTLGVSQVVLGAIGSSRATYINFNASNQLVIYSATSAGGGDGGEYVSTQVFRDPGAFYHIVVAYDSTQATSTNRIKVWINGQQITAWTTATAPTLNHDSQFNWTGARMDIGSYNSSFYVDGYLTEINFIDGYPTGVDQGTWASFWGTTCPLFGETNPVTGVWQPKKYTGTYGTNGFYLNFSDNSGATATTIGKDYSGNGNNWTPNNISVTTGVTYDSMLDVPTQWADGGNGRGNYCTLNPLVTPALSGGGTLSNGNLRIAGTVSVSNAYARGTMALSGKFYAEFFFDVVNATASIGVDSVTATSGALATSSTSVSYRSGGNKRVLGTESAYGASWVANDIIGVAVDTAANTVEFFKNGVSQGVITSSAFFAQGDCVFAMAKDDIGSPTGFANFGQRPFTYTPPTGFKALNTLNLPTPTILKGNQYMDVSLWTGNGTSQTIVNSGAMQPDFIWIKDRTTSSAHALTNAVVGFNKYLESNSTLAETTDNTSVTAVNSNGFTLGAGTATYYTNRNGDSFVGWQWKEGATQGFDIVTYTGDGVSSRTVAHSLGVTPAMIITKARSATSEWMVAHKSLGNGNLILNQTLQSYNPATQFSGGGLAAPNSSTTFGFVAGSGGVGNSNANGVTYVAYLFSEVAGFSKFGSYTGNGSADGPFVFCGFRPRFILFKKTSATDDWVIYDTARDEYNVASKNLYPNGSFAEDSNTTNRAADILSNGFKLRSSGTFLNGSGATFIYAAFAENPLKFSLAR